MTVDTFASERDGYTLETISFNFEELVTTKHRVSSGHIGVLMTCRCPHDEVFQGLIPLSKESLNDSNFFSEMMRMVDFGAKSVMENKCGEHDKKGDT